MGGRSGAKGSELELKHLRATRRQNERLGFLGAIWQENRFGRKSQRGINNLAGSGVDNIPGTFCQAVFESAHLDRWKSLIYYRLHPL
jgi:hypothetical protein